MFIWVSHQVHEYSWTFFFNPNTLRGPAMAEWVGNTDCHPKEEQEPGTVTAFPLRHCLSK